MKREQKSKQKKSALEIDRMTYEKLKDHLYSKKPLLGEESPFSEMLQRMVNKIIEGEMNQFISEEHKLGIRNKRNGKLVKKVQSSAGPIYVETPRDRNGDFEPELIKKRERFLTSGLDEQILALYAQGNSIEDVRRLLSKMFGVSISAGKISQITDSILPELESWRSRPLKTFYPVIYLDAIHFKVREDGKYKNTAFYTVYSVDWNGQRDILGLYLNGNEGASKWGLVLQDLKARGVEDVLVMCVDNLAGFSEVIQEEYPATVIQKCIVHQVRNSLKYVDEKDRKEVVADLRKIYTAITEEQAMLALDSFEVQWSEKYSYIVKQWRENWGELMAFLDFPKGMRKMIYTTNPVEAVHRIVRKLTKAKAAWSSSTALLKQLYLSFMHNEKSWRKKAHGWTEVKRDIQRLYPDRVPKD